MWRVSLARVMNTKRGGLSPKAEEPPVTMLDSKETFRSERMGGAHGRNPKNRLERVCRRIEASLGPLSKLALVNLKRGHARKLRDDTLSTNNRVYSVPIVGKARVGHETGYGLYRNHRA